MTQTPQQLQIRIRQRPRPWTRRKTRRQLTKLLLTLSHRIQLRTRTRPCLLLIHFCLLTGRRSAIWLIKQPQPIRQIKLQRQIRQQLQHRIKRFLMKITTRQRQRLTLPWCLLTTTRPLSSLLVMTTIIKPITTTKTRQSRMTQNLPRSQSSLLNHQLNQFNLLSRCQHLQLSNLLPKTRTLPISSTSYRATNTAILTAS